MRDTLPAARLGAVVGWWAILCAFGVAPPLGYAAPVPAALASSAASATVPAATSGPASSGLDKPGPAAPDRPPARPAAAPAGSGATTTFISTNVPPIGKDPLELVFTPNGAEVAIAN